MFFTYIYCNPFKQSSLHECGFEPFYVGKGQGRRHLSHLLKSSLTRDPKSHKSNTIKKITDGGKKPIIVKMNNFNDEASALADEVRLISLYGRSCKGLGPLTNVMPGGQAYTICQKKSRAARTPKTRLAISNSLKGQHHSEDRKEAIKVAMIEAKKKQQKKWLITTPNTSYCLVSLDYLRDEGLISVSSTIRTKKPISRGKFKGWQVSQITTS